MQDLGKRIKELRNQRGMILTELGERTNLSASYLSQIERNKATPSLTTLLNIAEALDVELRYFFESDAEAIHIVRSDESPEPRATRSQPSCTRLTTEDSGWKIDAHRLVLQPHSSELKYPPKQGEVLIFVLEGTLATTVGEERYVLDEGDSVHFDAGQPCFLAAKGQAPAVALVCDSPPRSPTDLDTETNAS